MFDRSVFVDDFSSFSPRCRLEWIVQAAAPREQLLLTKHSVRTTSATWGLSAYVCLHGRGGGGVGK